MSDFLKAISAQLDAAAPAVWEPVSFEVGDRVRIRLSGECQVHWEDRHAVDVPPIDGQAGVINRVDRDRTDRHAYSVRINESFEVASVPFGICYGSWCCAAELVPLADDAQWALDHPDGEIGDDEARAMAAYASQRDDETEGA